MDIANNRGQQQRRESSVLQMAEEHQWIINNYLVINFANQSFEFSWIAIAGLSYVVLVDKKYKKTSKPH